MSPKRKNAHVTLPPFGVLDNQGERDVSENFLVINPWMQKIGGFQRTYICIRRTDGLACSVKVTDKSQFSDVLVKRERSMNSEVNLMNNFTHPNLIWLYDLYENAEEMMLVTEFCSGGDLSEGLVERAHSQGGYSEKMVALVLSQVLRAVQHMHSLNILHYDLKPSSVLFTRMEERVNVKVVGFGCAKGVPQYKRSLNKLFGDILYMAPEVVQGSFTNKVDVWGVGAIMHALIVGYAPFEDGCKEKIRTVMNGIGRCSLNNNVISRMKQGYKGLPDGVRISGEARDLLHSLLMKNVEERYTVQQALEHSWFVTASHTRKLPVEVLHQLKETSAMDKFKASVVVSFCNYANFSKIAQLKSYFHNIDGGGNRVTLLKFEEGLNIFCPEVAGEIRRNIVVDRKSLIQFDEVCCHIAYHQLASICHGQKQIFEGFDSTRDSFLNSADLCKITRVLCKDPIIKKFGVTTVDVLKLFDIVGQVRLEDFLLVMHSEIFKAQMKKSLMFKMPVQERRAEVNRRSIKPSSKIIRRADSIGFGVSSSPLVGKTMCRKRGVKVLKRCCSVGFKEENYDFQQLHAVFYAEN